MAAEIINESIQLSQYKCFKDSEQGFDRIFPINIIIGKNNSGKSTLLELIQYIIDTNSTFFDNGRDGNEPSVIISHKLTDRDIGSRFPKTTSGGGLPGENHFEYGKQFIGSKIYYRLFPQHKTKIIKYSKKPSDYSHKYFDRIELNFPLQGKIFTKINAERDINQEGIADGIELKPNGEGATNLIRQIVSKRSYDSQIIEQLLLQELNKIVNPDLNFVNIIPQEDDNNIWEIFLEDKVNGRIPLSKMGSGLKTILLVLLNLIVIPTINNVNKSEYVFAFEELENNLHPALQRNLYSYIRNYSEENGAYFFITSHSNIIIDTFSMIDTAQIMHTTYDGTVAKTNNAISVKDSKKILFDLDVRASDILQSNGIIWVEGPSDRNFLNRWLKLLQPGFIEGHHFLIMIYGGKLLSNLKFDFKTLGDDLIPLLRINSNAHVIMDRDRKTITESLNKTKARVENEIGENNCWVTYGREIENYLTENTIVNWLKSKGESIDNFKLDKGLKFEESINELNLNIPFKYNLLKNKYSKEIIDFIDNDDINIYDLEAQVTSIIDNIKKWNSL